MAQHIKILSILFIIFGVLGLVFAIGIFLLGAGAATTILTQSGNDPDAAVGAAWAGGCMTFLAGLIGVLSIPSIIAGWGLSKRKSWARILTIVLAVLSLPHVPIGTAIGIYALVIMLNDESKALLTE